MDRTQCNDQPDCTCKFCNAVRATAKSDLENRLLSLEKGWGNSVPGTQITRSMGLKEWN